jgi:hypothetical protein
MPLPGRRCEGISRQECGRLLNGLGALLVFGEKPAPGPISRFNPTVDYQKLATKWGNNCGRVWMEKIARSGVLTTAHYSAIERPIKNAWKIDGTARGSDFAAISDWPYGESLGANRKRLPCCGDRAEGPEIAGLARCEFRT